MSVLRRLLPRWLRRWLWRGWWIARNEPARRRALRWPLARVALALAALLVRVRRSSGRAVGIDRLPAILVVNLARRPDRMTEVEAELSRIGIASFTRFEAIDHPDGALGCARSHIACLRTMQEAGWPVLMVCEDDLRLAVGRDALDALVDAFLDDPRAEVACLAYSHREVERHSLLYLRATRSLTTACYLVKASIADELAAAWEDGAAQLARGGDRAGFAADQAWTRLQAERVFLVPIVRAGRQAPGYSDIWETLIESRST